jgi:hypothetical protein
MVHHLKNEDCVQIRRKKSLRKNLMIVSREEKKFHSYKSFIISILMIALMSFEFLFKLKKSIIKKFFNEKIFSIAKKSF